MLVNEEVVSNSIEKNIACDDTNGEEPHVDKHGEPNAQAFSPTFDEPQAEPRSVPIGEPPKFTDKPQVTSIPSDNPVIVYGYPVDTPIIGKLLYDVFNDKYVSSVECSDVEINHEKDEVHWKNGEDIQTINIPVVD